MNILDVIPGISEILDKTVSKKSDLEKIKVQLRELDIREVEARLSVQKSWLENKSVFVAGAIPMMLWMVSGVVLFNHVIAPLLSPIIGTVPTLDLPGWYAELVTVIIVGLFTKKAYDGNTIKVGSFLKPAKGSEGNDALYEENTGAAEAETPQKSESSASPAGKYDAPGAVDARIAELAHRYGADR